MRDWARLLRNGGRLVFTDVAVITGAVAKSFTTTELGLDGVSVLLTRSFFADKLTSAFGVTGHEQQEIICSSGENAYTFAQSEPDPAPLLVKFTNESIGLAGVRFVA